MRQPLGRQDMRKRPTQEKLDRELVITGWALAILALSIFPAYVRTLFLYRAFAVAVAGDQDWAFSHNVSVGIMKDLGFLYYGVIPVCLLGTVLLAVTLILNARKRKQLARPQEQEPPNNVNAGDP